MLMYNRLFTKILDSSIWLEPLATRVVWITLLAAMDRDGLAAFACPENLARRAGVTKEECNAALNCLLEPDQNSSDPEYEGRRLERIPGGYLVLNAAKYKALFNLDIQREQTRIRVARHREKKTVSAPLPTVTPSLPAATGNGELLKCIAPVTQSEAVAEHKHSIAEAVTPVPASPERMRMRLLNGVFKRRASTVWSKEEMRLFKLYVLECPEDEFDLIISYYASGVQILRRDLKTLLNNWNGELDRARGWQANPNQSLAPGRGAVVNRPASGFDEEMPAQTLENANQP